MEGGEKMKKDYNSLQKEIDKLLWDTSMKRTKKPYHQMITDEKYKSTMKKIGTLVMKLEEENRRQKTYT